MRQQLILPYYNGDIVELVARNENGRKSIIDAPKIWSHFFVLAGQHIPRDSSIRHIDKDGGYTGVNGEELWRIETNQPTDVGRLKARFAKHWEADVKFVKRVLIDLGITGAFDHNLKPVDDWNLNPSILVIDIETLSLTNRSWKADMKAGRLAVAMVAFKYIEYNGKQSNVQFILDPDLEVIHEKEHGETKYGEPVTKIYFRHEPELLRYFWLLIKQLWPDIITGWNVKFDTTYPLVRSWVLSRKYHFLREYVGNREDWDYGKSHRTNEERATDFFLKGLKILRFDLMRSYAELYKPPSKKLKRVAKAEGISDREHETGGIFHTLYWEDRPQAIRYNWDDAWETWEINCKHDIIGFYWENKNFAGMETMELSVKAGNLLDTILLRLAKDNVVLPSRPEIRKKEGVNYEGAYVFPPIEGLHYNVATLDASKYYPSIILAYEKLFYPIVIKLVEWVSKGRDIVEKLLSRIAKAGKLGSDEWKSVHMRRMSRKFLLNAVYGTLGDMKFRLFNLEMAEKITALCRAGIKAVARMCEKMGFKVVAGDTDSVHVALELGDKNLDTESLVKRGKKYVKIINDFLHTYFKTDKSYLIEFKMEKIWQPIVLMGVKKMYFGRVVWQDGELVDRVVVKGLRDKRRDSSFVTNEIMGKVYDIILYKTLDQVLPYVRRKVNEFRTNKLEDIMISIGVNKELYKYKVDALHKRGSEYANAYVYKRDQIGYGSRVYVLYCSVNSPTKQYPDTDVIAVEDPDELPEGIFTPNYTKMLERCVQNPLEAIFKAVGLKWKDLTPKKNVVKLFGKKKRKKKQKTENVFIVAKGENDFNNIIKKKLESKSDEDFEQEISKTHTLFKSKKKVQK